MKKRALEDASGDASGPGAEASAASSSSSEMSWPAAKWLCGDGIALLASLAVKTPPREESARRAMLGVLRAFCEVAGEDVVTDVAAPAFAAASGLVEDTAADVDERAVQNARATALPLFLVAVLPRARGDALERRVKSLLVDPPVGPARGFVDPPSDVDPSDVDNPAAAGVPEYVLAALKFATTFERARGRVLKLLGTLAGEKSARCVLYTGPHTTPSAW